MNVQTLDLSLKIPEQTSCYLMKGKQKRIHLNRSKKCISLGSCVKFFGFIVVVFCFNTITVLKGYIEQTIQEFQKFG